ncbi:PTS system N-acetyl glucosamine specific transporter subunits IIABC [Pullulanibacillus camelliae]|uniref:PTS system N-acetyl glucosamine specific transporter subunits IIABC n=1 Tax=Pullulanibacillus camelliae TaxID=1707096 RepID=A0A8J3DZV2_9BACL|nr:N-acetylglucosamine-specific PTS transporter subunit IIBC [Pullulanibacillus camelliae]GGE52358.1 PTS system N-acetyl glucosamine specific transporter subunits IIABC [Pullulanibacillus camelliae]
MLGFLQKIGKSLMLPIAVLPAAGLLLRLGQPDLLNIDFIAEAGNAVFNNLPLIFAIGVAIGFAKDNNGAAALAGALGYLVLNACATAINSDINLDVLGGIIAGIIAGTLYNRYSNVKLPDWLAFFGGRRFVPIITSGAGVVVGFIFGYVWPFVQNFINWLANWMIDAGALGAAIYGFLNRILIPLGLHHVINTLVWFDFGSFTDPTDHKVYHGDITRFLHHDPSGGTFTAGFFPIMMFGLPAACLAMIVTAKTTRRKIVSGLLLGAALTSFITGVTEPIEFSFMFLSPLLYVVHALLTASSLAITYLLGIHDSFSFSASLIDYLLNYGIAQKPLLLLLIGIIYGVIYFVVFYFLIKWLDLKTPGREDDEDVEAEEDPALTGDDRFTAMAGHFLVDLGGKKNVTNIDNCATRLRLTIDDLSLVDDKALRRHGARGVVRTGGKSLQVIVGTTVEFVADAMKQLDDQALSQYAGTSAVTPPSAEDTLPSIDGKSIKAPLSGTIVPIDKVPDQVFSQKMMGDGFAIDPSDGLVTSPVDGTVVTVFPTKHAIGLKTKEGHELLIHFGLDTVNLKGEGFDVYVKEGDEVKVNQRLAKIDINAIKDKVPSLITPVIFTNLPENQHVKLLKTGQIKQGEDNIITIE